MTSNDLATLVNDSFIADAAYEWRGMSVDSYVLDNLNSEGFQSLQFQSDDIVVLTFPKSGTTWTKSILYCLAHHIPGSDESPLDRLDRHIHEECPNPDCRDHWGGDGVRRFHSARARQKATGERVIFHFHTFPSLVPESIYSSGCKVTYVTRNPKAAVLSMADSVADYFIREEGFEEQRDEVISLFRERTVNQFCNGTIPHGPWEINVRDGYERRNDDNFLFLQYEDIRANPLPFVKKLAEFTGLPNYEDSELESIIGFTGIDAMRVSRSFADESDGLGQGQLNKGEAARWKKDLTTEQQQRIDDHVLRHWPEGKQFLD